MKVPIVLLCLVVAAFAASTNHARQQNEAVKQRESQQWQELTRARELDESNEAAVESAEEEEEGAEEEERTGSFGSSKLGRVRLFKNNQRDNLRELIRRGYADWESYKEEHGE